MKVKTGILVIFNTCLVSAGQDPIVVSCKAASLSWRNVEIENGHKPNTINTDHASK